jgi:hypothetical protein
VDRPQEIPAEIAHADTIDLQVDEMLIHLFFCFPPNVILYKSRGTLNSYLLISRFAHADTITYESSC